MAQIKGRYFNLSILGRLKKMMGFKGEAKVRYLDNDYKTLSPGDFVKCAVTGQEIPLHELKYWSVDLQEAYCSPHASFKRYMETRENEAEK